MTPWKVDMGAIRAPYAKSNIGPDPGPPTQAPCRAPMTSPLQVLTGARGMATRSDKVYVKEILCEDKTILWISKFCP